MATSRFIPSVLQQENGNSISTERALKQVLNILNSVECELASDEDPVNSSIDDVETMLKSIDRY